MEQVLTYTIPIVLLILACGVVMHVYYKNQEKKRLFELRKLSQKEISPIRMQAYERLVLLLERTTPEHMLLQVNLNEMSVSQLQQHLLQTIRNEFDFNLSQQIYVSETVWSKLMLARNEMMAFVNGVKMQLRDGSSTLTYAKNLIEAYANNGATPHEGAMEALKAEAAELL